MITFGSTYSLIRKLSLDSLDVVRDRASAIRQKQPLTSEK